MQDREVREIEKERERECRKYVVRFDELNSLSKGLDSYMTYIYKLGVLHGLYL